MSMIEKLDAVKGNIPHYWPIGSFIHHNPLKGFEHLHFKEGLAEAQKIFGSKVYMDSAYFMELYHEGKIDDALFEKNLKTVLQEKGYEIPLELAKKFLMEVSPQWRSLRIKLISKKEKIDYDLYHYLEDHSYYFKVKEWLAELVKYMTLYEINDALFGSNTKAIIDKEIIEFVAHFVDENQTTISMPNRELGMFEAFKLYEKFHCDLSSEAYVEQAFEKLKVQDAQGYLLTHLLKLHGWAGFIKYRSEDPDYHAQQKYPSSLMDYMAVRLYYELKAAEKSELADFEAYEAYAKRQRYSVVLRILKDQNKLFGPALDDLERQTDSQKVLNDHISNELNLDALQIQHSNDVLKSTLPLTELASIITKLREEEGYIWLKSLEDSYIKNYVDEIVSVHNSDDQPATASATFCLDVRSEVIRRSIESKGPYKTFGAGGFLGIPIAFVEFDKAHEVMLAPAIVKPQNVVFELPLEAHEDYSSKKGMNKTTKKVLSDLKNNPYTPYIMVEAIGWVFGINLFGKTFWPQRTNKFLSRFKPNKPRTTLTLDKLSAQEIEFYVTKLHAKIIKSVLAEHNYSDLSDETVESIRNDLIFGKERFVNLTDNIREMLKNTYKITPEDYAYQKKKLALVGFTLEEKVKYLKNYLTMIGQVENFPEFVTIIGHGSISDNNPFESALDCGACGGNVSLPNTRALCMIANNNAVRAKMKEEGIVIPETTLFVPGLHITSTDEIEFYDLEILEGEKLERFNQVKKDFNDASYDSRAERIEALPYTHSQNDIITKSMDWSEPRPEWGLAGNMGVYAGPRNSVKHLKLHNRFFMHSYDYKIDDEASEILTRIFNGPLVVGEWINLEHYFSTVDNDHYGAGSKVYHNIVSKVGVYSGNFSDLKIGLPMQSVLLEGKAYHEPVRLISFVEAPLEVVGKAVENSIAKEFILNEWIRPVIIDKEAKKVYSYENGEFLVIKEMT